LRDYDGPAVAFDQIDGFIRNAAGLVLPYENFLLSPELVSTIKTCVAGGIPLAKHERDLLEAFVSHPDEWARCHIFLGLRPGDPALEYVEQLQRRHAGSAEVYPLPSMRLSHPSVQEELQVFL
jgi:hypothetical protein